MRTWTRIAAGLVALLAGAGVAADTTPRPNTAGPRIPYADPATLNPTVRAALAKAPANSIRILGVASEGVFDGLMKFNSAFYTATKLDPVLREVAILRVGYLANSRYQLTQHEAAARLLKMTDQQLAAIKAGGKHPGVLTDAEQAVLDFTDDVVRNVRAGDATFTAVRKHMDDHTLVDLILLIGCYMTMSRVLETTDVPLEDKALDWTAWPKTMRDQPPPPTTP
jgi:alkylhydroperoxidase family enzyme